MIAGQLVQRLASRRVDQPQELRLAIGDGDGLEARGETEVVRRTPRAEPLAASARTIASPSDQAIRRPLSESATCLPARGSGQRSLPESMSSSRMAPCGPCTAIALPPGSRVIGPPASANSWSDLPVR